MSAIREMIIIVAVLTAVLIGSVMYNDAQNKAEKAKQYALQHVVARTAATPPQDALDYTLTTEGAVITLNFQDSSVVRLDGVELCPDDVASNQGYSSKSTCDKGSCVAMYDFGTKPIPETITINRKYNGACIQQTLTDLQKFRVYSEEITINATVAKKIDIADRSVAMKTANSKYSNSTIKQKNGGVAITLEYLGTKPQDDEFLLGSKTIDILYNTPTSTK